MADKTKEQRVNLEKKRLNRIFKEIDDNKKAFVQHSIEELAWLRVTIEDLQDDIDKNGVKIKYQNGKNQTGWTTNPSVNTLVSYQKNSISIAKQLLDLVPSNSKSKIQDFLNATG